MSVTAESASRVTCTFKQTIYRKTDLADDNESALGPGVTTH